MLINTNEYLEVLEGIKTRIRKSQFRATTGMNQELIFLYRNIGQIIIDNFNHLYYQRKIRFVFLYHFQVMIFF